MIITVTLNPAVDKKVTADEIALGALNKCILERTDLSGKGINVSKAIAVLGRSSVATGFIGGKNAKIFMEDLDSRKITYEFTRIAGEMRTNIKLVEKKSGRETEINENGPDVTEHETAELLESLRKYYNKNDILCVCGSLPGQIRKSIYKEIINSAKKREMKVIFDSSDDGFKIGMEAVPFAIKPNRHEIETFFGEKLNTPKEIKDKTLPLIENGTEMVIVSIGAEGACFISKDRAVRARNTEKINTRGSIGAGDAMTAAYAVALHENMGFDDMVRLCVASATASVMEEGTVPGTLENINRLMDFVSLEDI